MVERIEKLQRLLPDDIDAAIIISSVNRRYFTGFKSSAGVLAVTKDQAIFIIDFRYIEAAKKNIIGCDVVLQNSLYGQLKDFFSENGVKNVAVESGYMTLAEFSSFQKALSAVNIYSDNRLNDLIDNLRKIKSRDELYKIRQAQDLTDEAFTHILNYIHPGISELEVALELEFYIRKRGAGTAFDFIAISGEKTSMPHGVPSEKIIKRGEFVTMDYGAAVDGYCSDMTRTIAVGEVCEEQKRIYEITLEAQLKAISAIKSGVKYKEIDEIARKIIYSSGYKGKFGHGLGHSVGLEIHEMPAFNMTCCDVTEPGVVITVEPGIYLEGKFGCRIEDMVYITEKGCIDLTASEKNLIII